MVETLEQIHILLITLQKDILYIKVLLWPNREKGK